MIRFAASNGSGDLGMVDPGDDWPLPDYNPGPQKHLHALGAISTVYNTFESRLFSLFAHHLDKQGVSRKISSAFYFQGSETQRIENIKLVFDECEKEQPVKDAVLKLMLYFNWCYETRNHLLHSRHDPPFFGHDGNTLHLTKRIKKTSKQGFLKLNLATLRNVADKIRRGEKTCLRLIIHLQLRDTPEEKWDVAMRLLSPATLPEIPEQPRVLELGSNPHTPPLPPHLRQSSQK
jgi:hypothetical protein